LLTEIDMTLRQTALVTGALSGIGRATAFAFAREGYDLIVSGRHEAQGAALVAELGGKDGSVIFVEADTRFDDQVATLVDTAIARFGRLDIAVNNAGTEGRPGLVVDQDDYSYAATFDTNVKGTLLCLKHELRVMLPQGFGSIVNISSTLGHRGTPGGSLYTASKHAIEGLTKSAAIEAAGRGVRVNTVAPGPTDTGMLARFAGSDENKAKLATNIPMGRLGAPEEIAQAILFVSSSKASFITGACLVVDGGKEAQDDQVGQGR
jgi:NAD(P)-dependent dehydrogenase (short-subunit alcohol dehydrogenase family)